MMFDCGSILKEGGIAFCVLSHMMFGDGSKFFVFWQDLWNDEAT